MVKAPAFLLLSLALAGCAVAPQAHLAPDTASKHVRYAWDGAGEDPNQPHSVSGPSRATRAVVRSDSSQAGPQPHSKDSIEAEQDARLNSALIICQGCLRPQQLPLEDARLARVAN
jgi:hypothetical protein